MAVTSTINFDLRRPLLDSRIPVNMYRCCLGRLLCTGGKKTTSVLAWGFRRSPSRTRQRYGVGSCLVHRESRNGYMKHLRRHRRAVYACEITNMLPLFPAIRVCSHQRQLFLGLSKVKLHRFSPPSSGRVHRRTEADGRDRSSLFLAHSRVFDLGSMNVSMSASWNCETCNNTKTDERTPPTG